jgi:hypothetical protein
MKVLYIIIILITGCSSYSSIHNEDLVRRRKEMLKHDYKMKRDMQKARVRATPKKKRVKHAKAKRKFI